MMTPAALKQFRRILDDPEQFAASLLMIRDDSRNLIPFQWNRAQRHFMANRTRRDLNLKSRQIGFSTQIQGDFKRLEWSRPCSTLTMADTHTNTSKMKRISNRFYDYIPSALPSPLRSESNASTVIYPGIGSESHMITAGSNTAGRGSTITHLHGSEVAFWRNADENIAGALQAVPEHLDDTWIVFESTANGAQGWFYEECMAALAGKSEWTLHFYAWWWGDKYKTALAPGEVLTFTDEETALVIKHNLTPEQIKWRRKKIRDLKEKFQQEYPETPEQAFLTSGGGVFALMPQNLYPGTTAESDSRIVAGLDWGQDNDYTALSIMELRTGKPPREVYLNRWRHQSYGAMISEVVDALYKFQVEKITPEKNSMSSNIERLIEAIDSREGLDCSVQPFTMSNPSKHKIVTLFKTALEQYLELLDTDYGTRELRAYQTKQNASGLWTYSAPDGKNSHDDTVIARMLANYTASQLWI
ncbi:MAG: hypothetical protein ACPG7F_00855 [Aggregatilineales bacterium]